VKEYPIKRRGAKAYDLMASGRVPKISETFFMVIGYRLLVISY